MAATLAPGLAPGFADPVLDSQQVFRALIEALSRPGTVQTLSTTLQPPAPLTPGLAAAALALADHEAPLWLDAALTRDPAVATYLRFHTGAPITADPREAAFALIADPLRAPPLDAFALGTPEYPDRSTTLLWGVDTLRGPDGFAVEGPGIKTRARLAPAPLPAGFLAERRRLRALFPLGIDCVFIAGVEVAGLPRSGILVDGE